MFVGIVRFPKIKEGKEDDFLKWFEWTTSEFQRFDGFVSRRLLKSKSSDGYAAIVELDDEDVHARIHSSPTHKKAIMELNSLVEEPPKREFYQLVSK